MKFMGVDIKKMFQDLGNLKSLYEEIVNFRNDHVEFGEDHVDKDFLGYDHGYVQACDDILALVQGKMKGVSDES